MSSHALHNEQSGLKKALLSLTVKVLRPLIRILLRHGMSSQEFTEISRWVFVDVAMGDDEFQLPGRKQFKSRAAILTGLSRKEVLRLCQLPPPDESDEITTSNRAARVLTGWTENPLFCDDKDKPRDLPFKGDTGSFTDLVRLYSGDVPPRAILDELRRSGAVEETEDGVVKLRQLSYFPEVGSPDELDVVRICANDLLSTMEHNLRPGVEVKFPQRQVYSARIPEEALEEVRDYVRKETETMARRVHHFIYDRSDEVKKSGKTYYRTGLGLYYFES